MLRYLLNLLRTPAPAPVRLDRVLRAPPALSADDMVAYRWCNHASVHDE